MSSQVDSLESTFELGSFTSYSDIQDKVSSLKNQINSESSNLDKKVVGIIKDGNNLVLLESSKFNSSIQYSVVNAKDLEGIKNLCSQLSSIKSTFEQEDSRRTDEYNTALIEVSSYNENLVSINSNIDSINNLRKDISRMINKEGIKNQDYTSCQNELLSFISLNSTQLMNLSLESSSSCLVLNETLSELRVTKSNSFSFKIMRLLRTLWYHLMLSNLLKLRN